MRAPYTKSGVGREAAALALALAVAAAATALLWPAAALAVKDEAPPVIQKRHFRLGSEFYLDLGGLVLDPFTKSWAPSLGWVAHINDHLGWEIVNASFIPPLKYFSVRTHVRAQLEDSFAVSSSAFDKLQLYATTGLVWKPLYGKFSVFNRSNLYADMSFTLAAGVARYADDSLPVFPLGVAGFGLRFYVSQTWSVRLDARDFVFFRNLLPTNDLYVGLGIALNLGGGE
jgi:outer membrane beta-barrel protein